MSNEFENSSAVALAEDNEQVKALVEKRNAVAYLRAKDCDMLEKLQGFLWENIQLHKILNEINERIAKLQKMMKRPQPKMKWPLLFAGLICILLGIILMGNLGDLAMVVLGVGAILAIIAIVLKVVAVKKWKEFLAETQAKLNAAFDEQKIAQGNIDEHWNNSVMPYINEIVPNRFPIAYVIDYKAVSEVLWLMSNMRADTIKEALNLYEEGEHRDRVEAALNSAARSAARSAAAAERSAAANERAASAAELTAANSAAMAGSMASIAYSAQRQAAASESVARDVSNTLNY